MLPVLGHRARHHLRRDRDDRDHQHHPRVTWSRQSRDPLRHGATRTSYPPCSDGCTRSRRSPHAALAFSAIVVCGLLLVGALLNRAGLSIDVVARLATVTVVLLLVIYVLVILAALKLRGHDETEHTYRAPLPVLVVGLAATWACSSTSSRTTRSPWSGVRPWSASAWSCSWWSGRSAAAAPRPSRGWGRLGWVGHDDPPDRRVPARLRAPRRALREAAAGGGPTREELLEGLNEPQRAAVVHEGTPAAGGRRRRAPARPGC